MSDERMRATVDAVRAALSPDGVLLHRWPDAEDGAFLAASFWMADCYARCGEVAEARRIFESVCSRMNDVGLMSEECTFDGGELIGNFPQALSHVGLINAAESIRRAEAGEEPE
jgi:GH15 family glucan-1,4-alpha-glucosidase